MAIFKEKKYLRVDVDKKADESLWMKCKSCGELVYKQRLRENNYICPSCGDYFFLTAQERIESLVDEGSFVDIAKPIVSDDPLGFVDSRPYPERIAEAQEKTGLADAIIVGRAAIDRRPVVIGVMDFRFVGGSMGSV
ncbi:acetyl-CoA carboxylase carboxyl transferase subunit beta, partial [Candidatus Acetothermia bacterium]